MNYDILLKHSLVCSQLVGLSVMMLSYVANQGIFNAAYSVSVVRYDNLGVPIVDYGYVGENYIGPQRNPLVIANYALSLDNKYNRTHDEELLQRFMNNADWLVENAISKGNYSILPFNFPRPDYNLEPPWQSSAAQGEALQVLVRANGITGDKKYLDTAKSLLNAFFIEVKDNGVAYKTQEQGWWYEAFAGNKTLGPRLLGGMMNALLGIYEYYQYTKDPAAKYLFDQGILALKNNLPNYEFFQGTYSTQSILSNHTNPAPLNVHLNHARQLGLLYDISGEQMLKTYHDIWSNYDLPNDIEQTLKNKQSNSTRR
jgi:hypothetical protein